MPLISVVTPVYNAEKYLREALESIINQTFSDWEYIIINDGSTDHSLDIIKEYAKKDSRIQFESIPNSGSAKIPRDLAISRSKGDWIVALDADDYLAQDSLEKLISRQRETLTEIVLQKLRFVEANSIRFIPNSNFDTSKILSGKDAVRLTIGSWQISASGMLIKRSFFNELSDPYEKIFMSSDELDTRKHFLRAKTVSISEAEYVYRRNTDSITQKPSIKIFDTLKVNEKLGVLLEENFELSESIFYKLEIAKFNYILYSRLLYLKHKNIFNKREKEYIRNLIKSQYLKVQIKKIRKNYSPIKRSLQINGYSLFCVTTYIQSKF